ncbi:MAG TPA: FG-GAP-like repeat-containing protein, partial [Candidatus Lokiarchaeia archaeon]|nr:FG-GAP-like repeat-containing protein [Candidatus Lokiarchaeia archaeon]
MISKRFFHIARRELPAVIRCVGVGTIHGQDYLAVGCIDGFLYILNHEFKLVGKKTFTNWCRCCAMGDLDGDGDAEIVAGGGDKTLKVIKYVDDAFEEIKILEFTDVVNACTIGDVNEDGRAEIVVGTWGSKVYVFDPTDFNLVWVKDVSGWVNFVITSDVTQMGTVDVVVGTRDGYFCVLNGTDGRIIWDYKFMKEVNAAAIGDVDNSGRPSILVGGNCKILTIFNTQGHIVHEIPIEARILSMNVEDIDGDNSAEIIIGGGDFRTEDSDEMIIRGNDKPLYVFENQTRRAEGISLKWRGQFENSFRSIQVWDWDGDGINRIICGGYNKTLHIIQDFNWGKKPIVEIAPFPVAPGLVGADIPAQYGELFYLPKINRIEDLLANSPEDLLQIRAELSFHGTSAPYMASVQNQLLVPETVRSLYELLDHVATTGEVVVAERAGNLPRMPSAL